MEFIGGRRDLEEFEESLDAGESIFFGRFPDRNSDSIHAVTLDLPDRDGIVRRHPH
jgi:hypothetical protein